MQPIQFLAGLMCFRFILRVWFIIIGLLQLSASNQEIRSNYVQAARIAVFAFLWRCRSSLTGIIRLADWQLPFGLTLLAPTSPATYTLQPPDPHCVQIR